MARVPATNIHESVGPIPVRLGQQVTLLLKTSDDYGFAFIDGIHVWDRKNKIQVDKFSLRQYLQTKGRHILQVDCEDIGAGDDNHWTLSFGLSFEGEVDKGFERLFFDHLRHNANGVPETEGVIVILDVI